MDRTVVKPEGYRDRGLPLSPAIRTGSLVFVSGQVAVDPTTGEFVGGDTATETRMVLKNLESVLVAAGSSLRSVVKTTVFLTNLAEFPTFNDVYRSFFPSDPPARSTVEVSRLVGSSTVEVEAFATVDAV